MKIEIDDTYKRLIVDDISIPYLVLSFIISSDNRALYRFTVENGEVVFKALTEDVVIWIDDSELKERNDAI